MARAFLLYCKIGLFEDHLQLKSAIDMTIFDSNLSFTQDLTIEISSSPSNNHGTPKRVTKAKSKQQ